MNIPYRKQYDENGVLTNPISGAISTAFPNRKDRRLPKQKQRFHGESKNVHLSITRTKRYEFVKHHRVRQLIVCKNPITGTPTGELRTIEHYVEKTKKRTL